MAAIPGTPAASAPTDTVVDRFPDLAPLDAIQQSVSAIEAHSFEPFHQLRWSESQVLREILSVVAIFWTHLTSIESVLELNQWKAAFMDLMAAIDKYVYLSLENIRALDTTRILEVSFILQQAFTVICRQITRLTHILPTIELPMGWLWGNRYCRTVSGGSERHLWRRRSCILETIGDWKKCHSDQGRERGDIAGHPPCSH